MRKKVGLFVLAILAAAGAWALAAGPATSSIYSDDAPPPDPSIPRIKLWSHTPDVQPGTDAEFDPTEPTMDIFLPPAGKGNGTAIVIFPGGAYLNLATAKEGSAIAKTFNAAGIAGFVVRYRHAPRYHYPDPLLDAQRAIRLVRAHAAEYKVDPRRIGVIGFSAGGHLAALAATLYANGPTQPAPDAIDALNARPAFAMLVYPVITFVDEGAAHKLSRKSLTNDDAALYSQLSPELHVTKDTPPIFLVHGSGDTGVSPMNSVLMWEACEKAGVPVGLHVLEGGPHGFGLGGTDPILQSWPTLALHWLDHNHLLKPS